MMELEYTNLSSKNVIKIKFKLVEVFVLEKYEKQALKQILNVILLKRGCDSLQHKMLHNSYISNPNGTNQRFQCRQNYYLWEKNLILISIFGRYNLIFGLAKLKFGLIRV